MYGITMWPLLKDVRSSSKMKTHIYLIGKTTIHSLVTFLVRLLSQTIPLCYCKGQSIYFCFIDYAKAFDCVDHNKLRKTLKEMRIQTLYLPLEKSVCRSRSNS